MAKISTIKEAIVLCRQANITPFIWGHRGLGKSSLVEQVTAEHNWGFIDLRCSQLEASDIRGLPDRDEGRTRYLPPADMPIGDMTSKQIAKELGPAPDLDDLEAVRKYQEQDSALQPRYQEGILFLDELNRAQDDVLQAAFQLVLNKKVGQYVVPPGWSIVVAGNFNEGYLVTGFNDPAFLDRFTHITLSGGETTLDEWVDYMAMVHGEDASDAIEFAVQNPAHLDGEIQGELGFSVQPSRRSWESVIKIEQVCQQSEFEDVTKLEVVSGLIGRELALSYSRYSCPVKPRDLLKNGVHKYKRKLKSLSRNQMTGLMWGIVSHCKHNIDDDDIAEVCLDFASYMCEHSDIDNDIVVAFCRAMVGSKDASKASTRAALVANPKLAKMVSQFKGIKQENDGKSFTDRLGERPELQKALSEVSWGNA